MAVDVINGFAQTQTRSASTGDTVLEVVYYVASSLDGFIATPDGGVEWLHPFEGTGEDYCYADFYQSVDSVLLGRRTYEKSLEFGERRI